MKFQLTLLLGIATLLLFIDTGTSRAVTPEAADVIPKQVSQEFKADYLRSLAAGRGNTFAKVGDSNSESDYNIYGMGCRADLNLSSPSLQSTADFYKNTVLPVSGDFCPGTSNSFTRRSAATRGGSWSTWPLSRSDEADASGLFPRDPLCTDEAESPLACEIRLTNARYTIIGGGSNDFAYQLPVTGVDGQRARFLSLVAATRANDSIPVLQTIPAIVSPFGETGVTTDNAAKIRVMNQTILDVGAETGVPVINLWGGTQGLPNKGMSRDGIHWGHTPESGGTRPVWVNNSADLSARQTALYGANARNKFVLETLRFLDGKLSTYTPAPPSSMNYDSISIDEATEDSIAVSTDVSGTVPPGASSVITMATTPRGTPEAVESGTEAEFTGLDSASTYYFRAVTTYGTSPDETKVGSSEIAATTGGALDTTITSGSPENPAKFTFKSNPGSPDVTFECKLDSAAFVPCKSPVTYPAWPANPNFPEIRVGPHTFSVRAVNQGIPDPDPATKSWTVTGPNVTIRSGPAQGSVVSDPNPSFATASTEPTVLGGIYYTLKRNGVVHSAAHSGPTVSFTDLPNGQYEFTVNYRDATNSAWDPDPPVRTWTINSAETNRPNVTIRHDVGPAEGWSTTSRSAEFNSLSTEASVIGVYILRRNGQLVENYYGGPTKSFTNLPDGNYTFTQNLVDHAGNDDPTPPVRSWTIDNVAPTTSIVSGPANSSKSNNKNPEFGFSSNEANVTYECRIWQGWVPPAFTPCPNPKTFTNLADGSWMLQVRAVDFAGNTDSTTAVRQWEIDTVPPNVTITAGPAEGSTTTNRNPSFTSASTKPTVIGGVVYTLKKNGAVIETGHSGPTKDFVGLDPGNYQFIPNWADVAGNLDPTPPVRSWTIQ